MGWWVGSRGGWGSRGLVGGEPGVMGSRRYGVLGAVGLKGVGGDQGVGVDRMGVKGRRSKVVET